MALIMKKGDARIPIPPFVDDPLDGVVDHPLDAIIDRDGGLTIQGATIEYVYLYPNQLAALLDGLTLYYDECEQDE